MAGNSFYQNNSDYDIWSKFYEQPEGYTLDEVYKSKNVYFVTPFYNGSVQSTLMECMAGNTHLHNHPIHASKEMLSEKMDETLNNDKTLEYIYIATEDAGYCEYFKEYIRIKSHLQTRSVFRQKKMNSLQIIIEMKKSKGMDSFLEQST